MPRTAKSSGSGSFGGGKGVALPVSLPIPCAGDVGRLIGALADARVLSTRPVPRAPAGDAARRAPATVAGEAPTLRAGEAVRRPAGIARGWQDSEIKLF